MKLTVIDRYRLVVIGLLIAFLIGSVRDASCQDEDPENPSEGGIACSQLNFTEKSLKKFNPSTIYIDTSIISSSSILNPNSQQRFIGKFLGRNSAFNEPYCFAARVKSQRRVVACADRERFILKFDSNGKNITLRWKKESYLFATIGLKLVSIYSPYRRGILYYFSNGIIREIDVKELGGRFRLRMTKVGTYEGNC